MHAAGFYPATSSYGKIADSGGYMASTWISSLGP